MFVIKNKENVVKISIFIYLWIYILYNLGNSVMPLFLKNSPFGTGIFGPLTACMFLGQFIVSPLWGILSDKRGRYIMALSPIGYGIGQIMYCLSQNNIIFLFISRILAGIFAILLTGQFVTFISDNAHDDNRSFYLTLSAIMVPLGMGFSYLLGGFIKSDNFSYILLNFKIFLSFILPNWLSFYFTQNFIFPFFLQFILGIITSILLYLFIKNNNHKQVFNSDKYIEKNIFKNILQQFKLLKEYKNTPIVTCVIISFFNSMAYVSVQSIQYYLQDNKGLNSMQIGNFVFGYSILSVVISLLLQRILVRKLSCWQNLLMCNLVVVFISLILGFLSLNYLLFFIGLTIVMQTILTSIIQNVLVTYSETTKGYLIGINQSAISFGSILGNFSLGLIYSYRPEIFHYTLPFVFMSINLLVITFLIIFKLKIR